MREECVYVRMYILAKYYFLEISFEGTWRLYCGENGVYFEVFVDLTKLSSFRQTAL